jgi:hypothetical protein
MRTQFSSILFALAMTGCQFSPAPTAKPVTTNDVAGIWSFNELMGDTTVRMTFQPDGTFVQEIISNGVTNFHSGTWSLNGPSLSLDNFVGWSQGWKTNVAMWWMVDGVKRLEIFGGAYGDPDSFHNLKYLGPPK